jgi:hypothetical protein
VLCIYVTGGDKIELNMASLLMVQFSTPYRTYRLESAENWNDTEEAGRRQLQVTFLACIWKDKRISQNVTVVVAAPLVMVNMSVASQHNNERHSCVNMGLILKYALGNWSVRVWIEAIWYRIVTLAYCCLHSKLISSTIKIGASLNNLIYYWLRSREIV